MSSSTKGHRFLSHALPAVAALAAIFTCATPERAAAVECLLDTNNNGVANGGDTDGGAQGTGADSLACGINTQATAEGSVAVGGDPDNNGSGTQATGFASTAVGGDAFAPGFGSTAVGGDTDFATNPALSGATASGQLSSAFGADSLASGVNSTALGAFSEATVGNATATGVEANAAGVNSTATGAFAQATGANSTATGVVAMATGDSSSAFGVTATAAAEESTALGFGALVVEDSVDGSLGGIAVGAHALVGLDPDGPDTVDSLGAIAIGSDIDGDNVGAVALFAGSTALGAEARALAPGSTALGVGAVADLPNEFVLGTVDNTYTAPGITSRLSRVRQTGPLELVTTDRFGHLAGDGGVVFAALKDVHAGVALGLAMEAPDLAPAERFALRLGYGNFEGDSHALGLTMIGSLLDASRRWTWDAGVGAGWSDEFGDDRTEAAWGGRAGVQVAW